MAELLQDVYQSLWHIKADLSQIWKQVRCFLCGTAFIGAIQQIQLWFVSSVGDDLPEPLLLQQVTPLLGCQLLTATSELTTSPLSSGCLS